MTNLLILAQDAVEQIVEEIAPVADTAAVDLMGAVAEQQAPATMGWSEILWITLIGFGLVFCVLVLLIYIIKIFGLVHNRKQAKAAKAAEAAAKAPVSTASATITDEKVAVIAATLYLASGASREEGVLTFAPRRNSAWSSKLLTLTQLPERK